MAACSRPFQNMRSTVFPNCCVLVPVHKKDNTRLKYPTGNEGTSVCLRAVLATSWVIRKYLLTSPLSSSVEQAKIIKKNSFLPVFLSYLLILGHILGQECLALWAQTLQHHTVYQILAWLEASSCHSSIKEQELPISKEHVKTDPAVTLLKTPTASALELVSSSSDIFLSIFSSQTTIQNIFLLLSAIKKAMHFHYISLIMKRTNEL